MTTNLWQAICDDVQTPRYSFGTRRAARPSETLRRIRPLLCLAGITRLADITGLDWIGIPVYQAVRPGSRLLSVSQGKGLTRAQAKVSALMESLEGFHAEEIDQPTVLETVGQMRRQLPYDPYALPLSRPSFLNDRSPIEWLAATDLGTGAPTWVPRLLCELNYCVQERLHLPLFKIGSGGLASGNTVTEAIIHALCEVIERDACRRYIEERLEVDQFVNPATVTPRLARRLLDQFDRAGMTIDIVDASGPIGVPCFEVWLGHEDGPLRVRGSGAYPSRLTALVRALTEAAQARLTYIAGSRDDMYRSSYRRLDTAPRPAAPRTAGRRYVDAPTVAVVGFRETMQDLVARVRQFTGMSPVAVDLRRRGLELPVVFVVAPGLEKPDHA